jgi:hypothetical protein
MSAGKSVASLICRLTSFFIIFLGSCNLAIADPEFGTGTVQYTLPAARTTTSAVENFTARKAGGYWFEHGCVGCGQVEFEGSPFDWSLLFDTSSMSVNAKTDGPRAQVLDKVGGVPYEMLQQYDPPYPGAPGARQIVLNVGNTGTLDATDTPTAAQKLARAFAVQDIISMAAESLATLGGGTVAKGSDQPKQVLTFPKSGGTTSFHPPSKRIGVLAHDALDVDILLHEYGHSIGNAFNFDDPDVGGDHSAGVRCGSEKLAWGEGLATQFSVLLQNISPVAAAYSKMNFFGDTFYTDTEDLDIHYDLEGNQLGNSSGTKKVNSKGFDDELSVSRMLWDLYDDTPDEILDDNFTATAGFKDVVALGAQRMWKLMTTNVPGTTRGPYTMKEFTDLLITDLAADPAFTFWQKMGLGVAIGTLEADHGLSPQPEKMAKVKKGPGPKRKVTLQWSLAEDIAPDPIEGYPLTDKEAPPSVDGYDNFSWFRVVFTDPSEQQVAGITDWFNAVDLAVPGTDREWEYTLSDMEYDQLFPGSHPRRLKWFVQTESSQYASSSLLPMGLFDAPIWSSPSLAIVPEPVSLLFAIFAAGALSMSRRRYRRPACRQSR